MGKPSESPGWWDQGGAQLCEWTSEGGLNGFGSVDADGDPPVIHRARVMAREASGRANVNLGGIAGVQLLSHIMWDRGLFFYTLKQRPPATITHPTQSKPKPGK